MWSVSFISQLMQLKLTENGHNSDLDYDVNSRY